MRSMSSHGPDRRQRAHLHRGGQAVAAVVDEQAHPVAVQIDHVAGAGAVEVRKPDAPSYAEAIRAALAARGLEIREKQ